MRTRHASVVSSHSCKRRVGATGAGHPWSRASFGPGRLSERIIEARLEAGRDVAVQKSAQLTLIPPLPEAVSITTTIARIDLDLGERPKWEASQDGVELVM